MSEHSQAIREAFYAEEWDTYYELQRKSKTKKTMNNKRYFIDTSAHQREVRAIIEAILRGVELGVAAVGIDAQFKVRGTLTGSQIDCNDSRVMAVVRAELSNYNVQLVELQGER